MKKNNPTKRGNQGENAAARYLEQNGWTICCRNYHSMYGEIDLIAANEEYIAFVEVKTRKPNSLYTAAEAVTVSKQRRIIKTAQQYLMEYQTDKQPRFDVCEVYHADTEEDLWEICYLEDAFQVCSHC